MKKNNEQIRGIMLDPARLMSGRKVYRDLVPLFASEFTHLRFEGLHAYDGHNRESSASRRRALSSEVVVAFLGDR